MQQHPRDLAANWLDQAKRDLESARYLADGKRYETACFSAQQSAEKALKAALIWLAGDRPRSHEIGTLLAELKEYRDESDAPLKDIGTLEDIVALDPYYVTTRYPDAVGGGIPGAKFFKPEADLALARATRALSFVAAILEESDER